MEELTIDNIMSGDELENLFSPDTDTGEESEPTPKDDKQETTPAEEQEIDPESLFEDPESVGGEETPEGGEKPESEQDKGSSPNSNNFYSSIAEACKEEGIFPFPEDESLKDIKTAEDFKNALERQTKLMLDEKQQKVLEALEYDVEPTEIAKYQKALDYLDGISEEAIKDESDQGVTLRKQLIYNDFRNRGYSEERAKRLTERSVENGTDIEDALDAKESNKEFLSTKYSNIIEAAKEQAEAEKAEERRQAESIKKAILETEEPFDGVKLDKAMRQKVFDTVSKPVYRDKDGNLYTALQKAQLDDNEGFIRNLGYIFTLTNGFKNLDGLVKGKVQKETKRGFKGIEQALRSTTYGGEPRFASGVSGEVAEKRPEIVLDI